MPFESEADFLKRSHGYGYGQGFPVNSGIRHVDPNYPPKTNDQLELLAFLSRIEWKLDRLLKQKDEGNI